MAYLCLGTAAPGSLQGSVTILVATVYPPLWRPGDVTERDVLKFATDELAVWAKRPDMTNVVVLDYDDGDSEQPWLH